MARPPLPRVWDTIHLATGQLDRVRRNAFPLQNYHVEALDEHRAIFEALCRRDAQTATSLLRTHLGGTLNSLRILLAREPDLVAFDPASPAFALLRRSEQAGPPPRCPTAPKDRRGGAPDAESRTAGLRREPCRAMAIPVVLKTAPEQARVWHHVFSREAPELSLIDCEHRARFPGVSALAGWQPPADLAARMPDLRLVFSVGAGIDHLPLGALPERVQIVRMVAPDVTRSMVEYVTLGVLALHRDLVLYADETRRGLWNPRAIRTARTTRVGILGLGVLGSTAAAALAGFGFTVRGWARSPKTADGVMCFAGRAALPDFLSCCDWTCFSLERSPPEWTLVRRKRVQQNKGLYQTLVSGTRGVASAAEG